MRNKPAISVIVPVYNVEAHLRKCLDSILNQTFKSLEVIIVNDGSTDQSGEISDEYVEKESRIQVIHLEKEGVSAARNIGVSQAKGDFIGFVDGDDYIDERMYKTLYEACLRTSSNISICKLGREINGEIINNIPDEFYFLELNNEEAMRELFKGNLYRFSLCNKLFSKQCFTDITFPVGRIHEDLSTTYKLFAKAEKAVYLNYMGYIYVKQEESILTKSYYKERLDAFVGWEEIIPFMKKKYPQLFDIVNSCFTYYCVDHIYYILNQVEDKQSRIEFLSTVQLSVQTYYKAIKNNSKLPYYYKFIITLFNYHLGLFLLAYHVTKKGKGFLKRKDRYHEAEN